MGEDRRRLKVLFISAWYPSKSTPGTGTFIREHAEAVMTKNDVAVIFPCDPDIGALCGVRCTNEEGIVTVRSSVLGFASRIRNMLIGKIGHTGRAGPTNACGPGRAKQRVRLSSIVGNTYTIIDDTTMAIATFLGYSRLIRMKWKPDIVHAHIHSVALPSLLLSKLLRVPIAVTDHYIYFPPRVLAKVDRLVAVWSMNRCNLVICPSVAYADALRLHGIRGDFLVVPNTVDASLFHPSSRESRRVEGTLKKLLFVGNLVPKKGIPILLEAVRDVIAERSDLSVHIVGDGPCRKEYEGISRRFGLESHVHFHGSMVKTDVAEFMRNCDFFVMPSYYEGFGVVYAEAMASGLPVVGSDVRGPDEVIVPSAGLLVPPGSATELRKAIEYMLDNHSNYAPEELHEIARARYSHESIGSMLDEAYRATLKTQ